MLYLDKHFYSEVPALRPLQVLNKRASKFFVQTCIATADHNVPTVITSPYQEELSRRRWSFKTIAQNMVGIDAFVTLPGIVQL